MIYDVNSLNKVMSKARFWDSPSPPASPDPYAVSRAQSDQNVGTAQAQQKMNMMDQYTPNGNLQYFEHGKWSDGSTKYAARTTLNPAQQTALNHLNTAKQTYGEIANNQLSSVGKRLSDGLDFSGLGGTPVANEQTRQNVAQSMYDRMNPVWDRDEDRMLNRLSTQGITQGSEAYKNAMDDHSRRLNDARLGIENNALNQMSGLYGLEKNAYDTRANEMVMERNQPINELAALVSGGQVSGPQFISTPNTNIANTDLMGAVYGSAGLDQQNYQAQQQAQNAMMGGLFGMGGSGLLALGM